MVKLKYRKLDDCYIVINAEGKGKAVIPSTYRGKPVTCISEWAFHNCQELTSVIIGDNVTVIGWHTFLGCRGLMYAVIGKSVKCIGEEAFAHCINLKSVTILDSVIEIGDHAFAFCEKLIDIVLPDSLTSIGQGVFLGCTGLKTKSGLYKAFHIGRGDDLICRDMVYNIGEWNECSGKLSVCECGLHYCTNLYEIFNYYFGDLEEGIVICECEVDGEVLSSSTSKCCARRLRPVRKLTRQEVIELLNNNYKIKRI